MDKGWRDTSDRFYACPDGPSRPVRIGYQFILVPLFFAIASACLELQGFGEDPTGLEVVGLLEKSLVNAIAKAESSVVAIARVRREDEQLPRTELEVPPRFRPGIFQREPEPTDPNFVPHEYGTGVVVGPKGLILTAYHVLGDVRHSEYFVWSEKRPFKAQVLAADPWLDLAILQVPTLDLRPIEFGDAKNVKRGQIVIALGNPFAIARDGTASASWGIISNVNRAAPASREKDGVDATPTFHQFGTLIQTDAKLNFGTSGGALINLQGQMIGLTTSLTALTGIDNAAGFAIPVDHDFKKTVEQLKLGKAPAYGFLGIAHSALAVQDRQQGKAGVIIAQVFPATPAAMSGLRHRDVITHVDNHPVHDGESLIRLVGGKSVGTVVELTVERPGLIGSAKPFKANVQLVKKHIATNRPVIAAIKDPQWRGMQVDFVTATPQFAQVSSMLAGQPCVAVVDVDPNSSAWKSGVRSGDFISHVGNSRVATPEQFHALVKDAAGDVTFRLVTRENDSATRTVSP